MGIGQLASFYDSNNIICAVDVMVSVSVLHTDRKGSNPLLRTVCGRSRQE